MGLLSRIIRCALLVSTLIWVSACSRPDPNPELKDPIYLDLVKEHKSYEKQLEDELKSLEAAIQGLASTESRSLDRKIQLRAVEKHRASVARAREMAKYYEIRAELRKAYGRKEYRLAFEAGEDWPNQKSYKAYKLNKTLREAPRNWSARVPKSSHQALTEEALLKSPSEEMK